MSPHDATRRLSSRHCLPLSWVSFYPCPWRVDRSWPVRTNGSDHAPHSLGRYVFAIGANESAARLSGVRVRLQKGWLYTVAADCLVSPV